MGYVLRKVKNDQSPVYNRWFARVDRPGTLSTRGLAQHMIEHGLVGNRADVESMLSKLSECIPELVAQGYGVKLDGIGIFYPTIKNRKGGAASVTEFTISENVEGVRFRFRPPSARRYPSATATTRPRLARRLLRFLSLPLRILSRNFG